MFARRIALAGTHLCSHDVRIKRLHLRSACHLPQRHHVGQRALGLLLLLPLPLPCVGKPEVDLADASLLGQDDSHWEGLNSSHIVFGGVFTGSVFFTGPFFNNRREQGAPPPRIKIKVLMSRVVFSGLRCRQLVPCHYSRIDGGTLTDAGRYWECFRGRAPPHQNMPGPKSSSLCSLFLSESYTWDIRFIEMGNMRHIVWC